MVSETIPHFIDPAGCPHITQMAGLETAILTGLHGEQMMMALNATLPGHTVPMHTHPHEQIGMMSPLSCSTSFTPSVRISLRS